LQAPLLPLLQQVEIGTFLLELCTPRAGELEVLTDLPTWCRVGIGVVNQKHDRVEPVEEITARGRRAIALFGAERVVLTPDCGFATFADNPVASAHVAEAKLRAIVRAAPGPACRLAASCRRPTVACGRRCPEWDAATNPLPSTIYIYAHFAGIFSRQGREDAKDTLHRERDVQDGRYKSGKPRAEDSPARKGPVTGRAMNGPIADANTAIWVLTIICAACKCCGP